MMKDPTVEIIEPEYCPEAVIGWYECTGGSQLYKSVGNDKNKCKRELSSKARKHLCALGWTFWYADKKTRHEIRFKSPNGKSYNSLKTACKRCIDDGVCVSFKTSGPVEVVESSFEEAHTDVTTLKPGPRVYKKSRVQARRCNKRRRKGDSSENELPRRCYKKISDSELTDDDEWTPKLNKRMTRCTRLAPDVSKKRPKVLRFGKRVREENCGESSSMGKHRTVISWLIEKRVRKEDGRSLMDSQKEALVSQNNDFPKQGIIDNSYQDQSDNICSICQDDGEVMLCDNCPSVFHYTCLGLEKVPDGDWFCPSCCCKLCNRTKCREDCEADHVDNSVLCCYQCERKQHIGCLKSLGFTKMKVCVDENWLCNNDCENVFFTLQKLIGKAIPVKGKNLTLTFLKKTIKNDVHNSDNQIERKLRVALGVMHECFDPMIDASTGRDIVADVIFSRGSELNRLNFKGFYTVILERNNEVISVATMRIYGQRVAEVPLVATRSQFRRQGMCRILMNGIENLLNQFGVKSLVLPSAHGMVETWIDSFGFARMSCADKYQLRGYTFLDFQDSTMCHKPLKKSQMEHVMY
ncbi:putative histone acetyltransferase chromatin regulator PHD family [Lupinus albus]|uniref:Putative histone acetyltransferase chromatin regulator PHD family n=1 Tax=Lupinus albus TaxID=3870 RepID=A0A6A4NJX8_LUPAL|nr:putative histone acetyltransferase chromatin regulator PHD family [Lupinus albus]